MTIDTAERRRVVIVDGSRRHDVVVPAVTVVVDALSAVGLRLQPGRDVLLETDGREIDPASRVDTLRDGAVLAVVDLTRTAPKRRRAVMRREKLPSGAWWFLGGAGALLAVLALAAPGALDPASRQTAGIVTAAAAVAAGTVFAARADQGRQQPSAAVISILILAFSAGTACVPALPAGGITLSVFVGLLLAAAVAGVMGVVSRAPSVSAEVRAVMIVLLVLAAVWGGALALHLDAVSAAAVTVGLAPVAHRVLVSSLVDVAPGTFIDYARFQTTRWSVRQTLPEEVLTIDADDADALVARSTARLTAGTFALVVAAAAAAPVALPSFASDDPLVMSGRIALAVTVVLAFMLGARKSTVPATRWMLRIGAAAIVVAVLRAIVPTVDAGMLSLLAGGCLVVGAATALLVIPAGRGVSSLRWSRAGDAFEWIAIALSLPAGLLAADAVDAVRGMMAA
ncbi:hypothetical protein [Microbacterium sp. P04]|uniref:hypothetical protein n=1 Tax=Microbacterium sp. P04 TaxID=3366947 RepID=UPI003746C536